MERIKEVKAVPDNDLKIDVTIKLKLSEQNFYHLEKAIDNHCKLQLSLHENCSKAYIEKYGTNDELWEYLITLRDNLRKEFNLNIIPIKTW